MENLSPKKLTVKVRKTPMLLSKRSQYRLSDFSYGEWILFENGEPKYYLNVHDEQYSQIRDKLKPDVETYLIEQFKKKRLSLSFKDGTLGIPLPSKSEIVEVSLEKLPLEYIVN